MNYLGAGYIGMQDFGGTNARNHISWHEGEGTLLYHNNVAKIETVALGIEIYGKLTVRNEPGGAGPLYVTRGDNTTSYADTVLFSSSSGTGQGKIQTRNSAIPKFVAPSDERLKLNITTASKDDAVTRFMGIQVRDYEIFENFTRTNSFGFLTGVIAQEYELLYPDEVSSDPEDPFQVRNVAGRDWEMVMVIQKQNELITDLLARVDALENP
jgi:hypothetical protein